MWFLTRAATFESVRLPSFVSSFFVSSNSFSVVVQRDHARCLRWDLAGIIGRAHGVQLCTAQLRQFIVCALQTAETTRHSVARTMRSIRVVSGSSPFPAPPGHRATAHDA
jgi:hypothetical protein